MRLMEQHRSVYKINCTDITTNELTKQIADWYWSDLLLNVQKSLKQQRSALVYLQD